MKNHDEIQQIVWNKVREINNGSITLSPSHSSDKLFIDLAEYFLPRIDETPSGQEFADALFVLRPFDSFKNTDKELLEIKSDLGSLDASNSKEDIEYFKNRIKKNITEYKKRKDQ